jgi:hypothetical protein
LLCNNGACEITASRNSEGPLQNRSKQPGGDTLSSALLRWVGAPPFEEMNEQILLHSWQVIKFSRSLK